MPPPCWARAPRAQSHSTSTSPRRMHAECCSPVCIRRLERILHHRSNRWRRRLRRRPCRLKSLPDQRSLAGTSSARAAGVTLPHGTMRRSSSRAAARRRSRHPTARHEGGWAALRCRSRPVRSLQKAFELRSCHLRAPCPPSRGACDFQSLCRGRGTSCLMVTDLYFDSGIFCPAAARPRHRSRWRTWTATATSTCCLGTTAIPA